jgi:hypothetical protein
LRRFCRDGDGDITGSDTMWVNGRVQSAVAGLRLASAIRRRSRQQRLVIGVRELRFAGIVAQLRLVAGVFVIRVLGAAGVATRWRRRDSAPVFGIPSGRTHQG